MTKDRGEEVDKTGKIHAKELRSKEAAKKKKEDGIPTKVVIRRLPPSLTQETLVEELGPLPDHDFLLFVAADMSLVPHAFCRAYINFKNPEDIISFKDKFDGYIFTDTIRSKKVEYPAIVEFAPYQKVPKGRSKKKDTKCATIEQDPDYLKFLESLKDENAGDAPPANIESLLEEIEARDRKKEETKMTTPLLDFIKNRRAAAARAREEAREERRRKEEDRRRRREEERRKRREEERRKKRDKERAERAKKEKEGKDKDGSDGKEEESVKSVKLLKNPEREQKDTEKHRPKDQKRDRTPPRKDDRRESARERRDRERRERRDKERDRRDRDDRDEERDYGKDAKKDIGHRKETTKDDKEREKERQRQREKERERQRQRERERQDRQRREREERERKKRQESEKEKKKNSEKTDAEEKTETDGKEQVESKGVRERHLSTESDTSRKSDATDKERGAKGGEDNIERELTKEEARAERRRLRNKDRPTMQLYRPGARRRQDPGKGKNNEEPSKESPRDKEEDEEQEE
ncbi:UPF3A [Branchiostoma lanceolatum]|uniref:UPF3A protein n=1 Tax=Branchiostoma lanceolatum TaxID=7740 RepID=A0A8J9YZK6_BRALA|nr:UPF3A [Branchiostoma lanceolatum]